MDRVFNDWHNCTRCNSKFNWQGHYFDKANKKTRYINVIDSNIKDIKYMNGKYIIQLNCKECGHSDEITIEDNQ